MTYGEYVAGIESLYLRQWLRQWASIEESLPARGPMMGELLPWTPKRVLIVAPHPDDECLMAGAALRLMSECSARVEVVPFSYGSNLLRQEERSEELSRAVRELGFEVLDPREEGNRKDLQEDELRGALERSHPDLVLCPHDEDAHPTHIRCSKLTQRAIRRHVNERQAPLILLESEYWHPLRDPNLRVSLSVADVTRMGEGLLKHAGEVARNPYHLSLPAWLMDQERRGVERIHGLGSVPPARSVFSQIYRMTVVSPEVGS
jgi:LmbE family N-acetylglucosaminyl deacetylase